MNPVDVAILAVLGIFLLKGLLRGLVKEVCSLIGLVAGAFVAFRFYPPLAEILVGSVNLPTSVGVAVAFGLLFGFTYIFFVVLGYLLSRLFKAVFLGGANRVAGGLFGLVQGAILLSLILFTISLGSSPEFLQLMVKKSELAPPFVDLGEKAFQGGREMLHARG